MQERLRLLIVERIMRPFPRFNEDFLQSITGENQKLGTYVLGISLLFFI